MESGCLICEIGTENGVKIKVLICQLFYNGHHYEAGKQRATEELHCNCDVAVKSNVSLC